MTDRSPISEWENTNRINGIFSKEYITELKNRGNSDLADLIVKKQKDNKSLVFILENLGYLPKGEIIMSRFSNAMEVFKLLDKSNCRQCLEPTCMAFAGAVFKGVKRIEECPRLSADIIEKYKDNGHEKPGADQVSESLERLKRAVAATDLASKAAALGGRFSEGRLTIKVMGKDVSVDSQGNVFTDIHTNPWIIAPFLNYVVQGSDEAVSGKWVPFRELPNGRIRNGLFVQQCETRMKKVADSYPDFFEDIIRLFNGKHVEKHYQADISLVLHPLPKMPLLICYWLPDDGIASDFHLFFDADAETHLSIDSVFSLGAGMARMFEKLALRHGLITT